MNKARIIRGHVLEALKELQDNSVHCVITSPPYWGLRDYGIEPQVWGGDKEGCEHEWGEYERQGMSGGTESKKVQIKGKDNFQKFDSQTQAFCRLCGAWRGSYGLEPTIELYVQHTVEIFREVRRVMRPDAVCFLNIGDSFFTNPGKGGNVPQTKHPNNSYPDSAPHRSKNQNGLKPKDLCMVPARVALALQADGFYLRSEITWVKPNPLPESVTDRPTKSTEKIYLLTKSPRYFWDAEAVREKTGNEMTPEVYAKYLEKYPGRSNDLKDLGGGRGKGFQSATPPNGRNLRDAWTIATEPFPHAHFATFPQRLVEICLKAGTSERGCCPKCKAPWVRMVERKLQNKEGWGRATKVHHLTSQSFIRENVGRCGDSKTKTLGWRPSCKCELPDADVGLGVGDLTIPCTVLDPFGGAGTVGLVAAKMGRDCVGIELKQEYCDMAAKRIKGELGMLAVVEVR